MAHAKHGATSGEWAKHLRSFKRNFWKRVRRAAGNEVKTELGESTVGLSVSAKEMRRPERFAEALKEEIGEVVGFELDDPRLVMVTVTDVTVAPDLRDAKVFVLITGTDDEIAAALKTLRNASTFVRQQVAMNLDLRHAPHIHFVRDTAEENAARVSEILQDLEIKGEFEEKEDSDE